MDVLIKLSYDETVSLNGSESDDIYCFWTRVSVGWETYGQLKKRKLIIIPKPVIVTN